MKIYRSFDELIGHTPLYELRKIEEDFALPARLLAKLEMMNPGGSVKDRVALSMIEDAERRGVLRPGMRVIEPTSGNTGIGLAAVSAARGYRATIVMPDNMSKERQLLMRAYGAELILTPGAEGMAGAIRRAEEIAKEDPESIIAGQFENPENPAAHFRTTGPEIYEDTDGEVDIFVAGVGTGGTLSGVASYLKSKKPSVKAIAVEPENSAVLSGKKPGAHGLQGIGAGFIPKTADPSLFDEVMTVSDEEAYAVGRTLARREGILSGISAGAALAAAIRAAGRPENAGKTVVVLLPDTGDRYLSTPLYAED